MGQRPPPHQHPPTPPDWEGSVASSSTGVYQVPYLYLLRAVTKQRVTDKPASESVVFIGGRAGGGWVSNHFRKLIQ